ncbi:MAG: alanine acetyltransferase, partial [Gaiellales bacterium]
MDVSLRPLAPGDAELMAGLYQSQRDFMTPFDPSRPDSFYTVEGQRDDLELLVQERAHDRLHRFLIEADGAPAGAISVSRIT